jgi:phosphatidate cytidylyltransferase
MRQRLISAGVLVPVVVAVFLAGQPWLTVGLALLALLGAAEAFRLLSEAGLPVVPSPRPLAPWPRSLVPSPGMVVPPVAVLALGLLDVSLGAAIAFVAAVIVLAAVEAFGRPDVRDGFLAWVGTTFGVLYASLLAFPAAIAAIDVPIPAGAPLAGPLGWLGPGRTWLLVLVLTVWSFDSFAYLAGRSLGRGRFMAHISPKKTWSGVIGGIVAASVVAGALGWATGQPLPSALVFGVLVAVAAQAGDLAESMLKRAAGAKDSGSLIPGHGGILDRIDSFLFAAPAAYAWLLLVGVA